MKVTLSAISHHNINMLLGLVSCSFVQKGFNLYPSRHQNRL